MTRSVELSALDLRYEGYRMRNPAVEARLLASLAERGMEQALEGVDAAGASILLNGFKRYRCALKLRLRMAPYASLGEDEASAIVTLLRVSNDRSLTLLEQARFLEELRQRNALSVADIADRLSRSKSWVSMRLGLMAEMSAVVREKLFRGEFPVYPYMYTLRQFMRMNGVQKRDIEDFVVALAGKHLRRARDRTTGARVFSRAGLVSRSHPARTRGPGIGLVSTSASRPGWLQRV
jgi:predicted transcriptional regulator